MQTVTITESVYHAAHEQLGLHSLAADRAHVRAAALWTNLIQPQNQSCHKIKRQIADISETFSFNHIS